MDTIAWLLDKIRTAAPKDRCGLKALPLGRSTGATP